MKLAVLSDTHNLLRPEVLDRIAGCDAILHAGDICRPEILSRLREIAPVYAVRGNNDRLFAEEELPVINAFELGGRHFLMAHIKRDLPADPGVADVIITGHSHRWGTETKDGRLWLNPGSCGPRRFNQEITFAFLILDENGIRVQKEAVPHG